MKRIAYCIAAATIFTASSANAAMIDFLGLGWKDSVNIYHNGNTFTTQAGEIKIKINGTPAVAFCVDLDHTIKPQWSADLVPVSPFLNGGKAAAFLYDTFKDAVTNNIQGAALQVAIWEVVDDFGGSLDLTNGVFRLLNNAAVGAQANAYLGALPGDLSGYNTTSFVIKSGWEPRSQNLIAPEPGMLAVIGLGMPLLLIRRRLA